MQIAEHIRNRKGYAVKLVKRLLAEAEAEASGRRTPIPPSQFKAERRRLRLFLNENPNTARSITGQLRSKHEFQNITSEQVHDVIESALSEEDE